MQNSCDLTAVDYVDESNLLSEEEIYIGDDTAALLGINLLNVVGKVFCKILNNRLVQCLDKGALH